jgi:hypothetical protein
MDPHQSMGMHKARASVGCGARLGAERGASLPLPLQAVRQDYYIKGASEVSETKTVPIEFIERIKREMPDGTVIASPEWWAPRLYRWAIAAAPNTAPDTNSAQTSSTLVDGPEDELARLERMLAQRHAIRQVNSRMMQFKMDAGWTTRTLPYMGDYVRYLELRGLLEHHPTDANLVRVKDQS